MTYDITSADKLNDCNDGCLILLNKNNLTKKGVATITGDAFLTDDWEVLQKYRKD